MGHAQDVCFSFIALTPRESQILRLLGQGNTTKDIANELMLSCDTVATHRKRLCKKIGIHSTAELIAYACRAYPA